MTTKTKKKIDWIDGRFETPVGLAEFVNIDNPSDKFGPPEFDITVQFVKSEAAEFICLMNDLERKYVEGSLKKKWTGSTIFKPGSTYDPTAKTSKPDDSKVKVRFKLAPGPDGKWPAAFKGVIDANGQPCKEPWNGDKVKVGFTLGGIDTPLKRGLKPYMKAIQVVERRGGGAGGGDATSWFSNTAKPEATDVDDLPPLGDTDDLLND